jgi:hypothetical protein
MPGGSSSVALRGVMEFPGSEPQLGVHVTRASRRPPLRLPQNPERRSAHQNGGLPERPKGADCKSAAMLRRFESSARHQREVRAALYKRARGSRGRQLEGLAA